MYAANMGSTLTGLRRTHAADLGNVGSNAVLHWVQPPEAAVESVGRALRPGGRFVAELGGEGNIALILDAMHSAREEIAPEIKTREVEFFFPSASEYTSMLESHGFSVTRSELFDRLTPLEGREDGMRTWLEMFAGGLLDGLATDLRSKITTRVEAKLKPRLYRDGRWAADYTRLRVVASRLPNKDT